MREDEVLPRWLRVLMMDVSQLGALCRSDDALLLALRGERKGNWKAGTPFAGSTLTPGMLTMLLLGLALKQPSTVISAWTGLSESSVRWWRRKLNEIREAYNV